MLRLTASHVLIITNYVEKGVSACKTGENNNSPTIDLSNGEQPLGSAAINLVVSAPIAIPVMVPSGKQESNSFDCPSDASSSSSSYSSEEEEPYYPDTKLGLPYYDIHDIIPMEIDDDVNHGKEEEDSNDSDGEDARSFVEDDDFTGDTSVFDDIAIPVQWEMDVDQADYRDLNHDKHAENGNMESESSHKDVPKPLSEGKKEETFDRKKAPVVRPQRQKPWKSSRRSGGPHRKAHTVAEAMKELDSQLAGTKDAGKELRNSLKTPDSKEILQSQGPSAPIGPPQTSPPSTAPPGASPLLPPQSKPKKNPFENVVESKSLFVGGDKFNVTVRFNTVRLFLIPVFLLFLVGYSFSFVGSTDIYGWKPTVNCSTIQVPVCHDHPTFCRDDFESMKGYLLLKSSNAFKKIENLRDVDLDLYNLDDYESFKTLLSFVIEPSVRRDYETIEELKSLIDVFKVYVKNSYKNKCVYTTCYNKNSTTCGRRYESYVAFTLSAEYAERILYFLLFLYLSKVFMTVPITSVNIKFDGWHNDEPTRDERADLSMNSDIRHTDPKFFWVKMTQSRKIRVNLLVYSFDLEVSGLPTYTKKTDRWLISMELFSQLNHPKYVNFLNEPQTVLSDLMYGARSIMTINLSRKLAVSDYYNRNLVSHTVHCVYYAYLEHLKEKETWNFLLPDAKVIASFTGTALEKSNYLVSALLKTMSVSVQLGLLTLVIVFLSKFLLLEFVLVLLFLMVIHQTRGL